MEGETPEASADARRPTTGGAGDAGDALTGGDALVARLYDELKWLAAQRIAAEAPGHTLTPTALVHEAWLRLHGTEAVWRNRTHFLRTAARAMRRILVDRARAKVTAKRGGGAPEALADASIAAPPGDLVGVDAALEKLAADKPEHARLVELRFFGGLTRDEAAAALGVSPATADRMWRYARAWLAVELEGLG